MRVFMRVHRRVPDAMHAISPLRRRAHAPLKAGRKQTFRHSKRVCKVCAATAARANISKFFNADTLAYIGRHRGLPAARMRWGGGPTGCST
ncbi:hypothetical protein EGT33_21525 [Burkholderia multivorans]|nr:hypothetical protein EGT33_21525 [Burkholderia multivorans]